MSTDLLAATAELVAIPSVSRDEAALADHVEARLGPCRWLRVERVGDNVIARTMLGRDRRVVIAGHLDTVPPAGNETPRIDGDTLFGLGSADMKGGIAVMLDLATAVTSPVVDVTWCFYRGEEIDHTENGLVHLFAERPELLAGDAAVLCEPTACLIEAGCQGSIRARIVLVGKRAHSARPHLGTNAIHRMAPVLERVTRWEPRTVTLDGCEYTERLQVVGIEGGVASNVVPDRAAALMNFRFAPDRSEDDASGYLRGLFGDLVEPDRGDAFELVDVSRARAAGLGDPLLAKLLEATGRPPRAKLGWTDVATFTERGVPATNFGPGDPDVAHQADEHIERASLERARSSLAALIGA